MIPSGTVLILMGSDEEGRPQILESVSDDPEVSFVEQALAENHPDPVWAIRQRRLLQEEEDERFADYVEGLLSAPACRLDIQGHASQWFRSRINLQEFRRNEAEAREVIARFALQVFCEDPSQTDFILASAQAEVRVVIRVVGQERALQTA